MYSLLYGRFVEKYRQQSYGIQSYNAGANGINRRNTHNDKSYISYKILDMQEQPLYISQNAALLRLGSLLQNNLFNYLNTKKYRMYTFNSISSAVFRGVLRAFSAIISNSSHNLKCKKQSILHTDLLKTYLKIKYHCNG